eukprot:TRINITY_DN945_c0_g1_i9.p2 TRINITY_DN945_c0_g1~~TRINITY_DN945_c0_g1_i9.p2  ORF type:complete len:116 (+),score=3.80 TRINITY_DN945_c0_g1_i9:197-544(+)
MHNQFIYFKLMIFLFIVLLLFSNKDQAKLTQNTSISETVKLQIPANFSLALSDPFKIPYFQPQPLPKLLQLEASVLHLSHMQISCPLPNRGPNYPWQKITLLQSLQVQILSLIHI